MHPGLVCIVLAAAVTVLVWVLSLVTHEYSWTDRVWSLAPIGYAWVFAGAAGLRDARLDLVAVLITVWGARLTYNFARKGGYAPGGEDYRWPVLRARMRPWQFALFNAAFIALYQNVIILLMTLPMWAMYDHRSPLDAWDVVLAGLILLAIGLETAADEQQWRFQQSKRAILDAGGRPERGFLDTGLFAWCRHPNYLGELSVWWLVFLFAAHAAGSLLLPTLAGPVLLTALFLGSVRFTESISASRYPDYVPYQRRTPALLPGLGARRAAEAAGEGPAAQPEA